MKGQRIAFVQPLLFSLERTHVAAHFVNANSVRVRERTNKSAFSRLKNHTGGSAMGRGDSVMYDGPALKASINRSPAVRYFCPMAWPSARRMEENGGHVYAPKGWARLR
ncbi:hypothetical protein BKA66DRAFT_468276 [Pyrenochaeta sp. MPI-SDFR-AT-0127]|nr:hypothetical protein BKA66DRAFT_468276 [Pyrenochaeta sp. MPI-SDFR-AT-0127]